MKDIETTGKKLEMSNTYFSSILGHLENVAPGGVEKQRENGIRGICIIFCFLFFFDNKVSLSTIVRVEHPPDVVAFPVAFADALSPFAQM